MFRFPYILFKIHAITIGLNYRNIHCKLKRSIQKQPAHEFCKKSVLKTLSKSTGKNMK